MYPGIIERPYMGGIGCDSELRFTKHGDEIRSKISDVAIPKMQAKLEAAKKRLHEVCERSNVKVDPAEMLKAAESPEDGYGPLMRLGGVAAMGQDFQDISGVSRQIVAYQEGIKLYRAIVNHLNGAEMYKLTLAELTGFGFE